MRPRRAAARWILLAGGLCLASPAIAAVAEEPAVAALVAGVREAARAHGIRARATLVFDDPGSGERRTVQLLIKTRRDDGTYRALYQCLWPDDLQGEAYVVELAADRSPRVSHFSPAAGIRTLAPEQPGSRLFGSDLTLDDLGDAFWRWPAEGASGELTLLGHPCRSVEFRRPGDAGRDYASARVWIAPDILLPLQIEKLSGNGELLRRIRARKVVQLARSRWGVQTLEVQVPGVANPTTLTFQRSSRTDVDNPPADFTAEGLKRSLERLKGGADPGPPPPE